MTTTKTDYLRLKPKKKNPVRLREALNPKKVTLARKKVVRIRNNPT